MNARRQQTCLSYIKSDGLNKFYRVRSLYHAYHS